MRLTVVSDAHGNILSLFGEPAPGGPVRATLSYVPKSGERVQVLDVPREFETVTLANLHAKLQVATHDGRAALVRKA